MVDMERKKVVLKRVRKGKSQSTYVVTGDHMSERELTAYLEEAKIPYNRIYFGSGRYYVKVASRAPQIRGVYQEETVYVDEAGLPISRSPDLDESGQPISRSPEAYKSTTQQVAEMTPEERREAYLRGSTGPTTQTIGKEVYSRATPTEQVGLHAQTLMSPRGWEYLGSYPASVFFEGQRSPQDIVEENLGTIYKMTPEERRSYVTTSMFVNPPAEVGYAVATGIVGGVAVSAVPRIGAVVGSKAGTAVAVGLTGAYAVSKGGEIVYHVQHDDYSKAFGTGFQVIGEVGGVVKGWRMGQRIGGDYLLGKTDPALGKASDIAKRVENTKSEWIREPENVDIMQLRNMPKTKRLSVFDTIKGEKATIFGSVSKETQHMPGLRGSAADVDLAAPKPGELQRALLPKVRGSRPKGSSIINERGHLFDIKAESRLTSFPRTKPKLRTPRESKITRLDEEMWRSLFGAIQRGGREGWQGAKDINRFYKAARTLGESKRIQAEQATIMRARRLRMAEEVIEEIELFRIESPKISERLRLKFEGGKIIEEPQFVESYIPRGVRSSIIPRSSRIPSSNIRFSNIRPSAARPTVSSLLGPEYNPTASRITATPRSVFRGGSGSPPTTSSLLPPRGSYPPPRGNPPSYINIGEPPPAPTPKEEFLPSGRRKIPSLSPGRLVLAKGYSPSFTGIVSGKSIKKAPSISTGLGLRPPARKK